MTTKALSITSRYGGFTLVEVLVAVLVLSIGLLGLAGLQATSLRHNHDAQLRSQATMLALDMADRMRANRAAALDGAYGGTYGPTDCDAAFTPESQDLAARDTSDWTNALACLLPRGRGAIEPDDDAVTITVRWVEDRTQADASDENALQIFTFSTRL